jgi:hypothetical protein
MFLHSTYEDIVRTNQELQQSQAALSEAEARVERYAGLLEGGRAALCPLLPAPLSVILPPVK